MYTILEFWRLRKLWKSNSIVITHQHMTHFALWFIVSVIHHFQLSNICLFWLVGLKFLLILFTIFAKWTEHFIYITNCNLFTENICYFSIFPLTSMGSKEKRGNTFISLENFSINFTYIRIKKQEICMMTCADIYRFFMNCVVQWYH